MSEKKNTSKAKHPKPAIRRRRQPEKALARGAKSRTTDEKSESRASKKTKTGGKITPRSQEKGGSGGQPTSPRTAPQVNKKSLLASPSLNQTPKRRSVAPKEGQMPDGKRPETEGAVAKSEAGNSPQVHTLYPGDGDDPYPAAPLDVTMLGIGSRVFPPDLDLDFVDDEALDEEASAPLFADDPSVEMRIREIEERLDGLMASVPGEALDEESSPPPVEQPSPAESAIDTAREVLQSDYYQSKWGRSSLRQNTAETDEFGRDQAYEQKLRPALEFLFKKYFRVEVEGIENIPDTGRAVVVANHSGALPFDGVMLREAVRLMHPKRDELRWLAEDFSFYLPFLGVTLNRIGAVRACPENAERLLLKEHLVGVFPEGAEGIKKLYKDRYQLQRFGRGGFIRLCLRTRSPIIPCAIVGAEETNPIVYRFDNLSKLLGLDYLPITPTFPLLGPFGLLPAPTKWKIVFGEAISLDEYGPQAARDHVLVGRLAERVRSNIGELLEATLRRRKSVWL